MYVTISMRAHSWFYNKYVGSTLRWRITYVAVKKWDGNIMLILTTPPMVLIFRKRICHWFCCWGLCASSGLIVVGSSWCAQRFDGLMLVLAGWWTDCWEHLGGSLFVDVNVTEGALWNCEGPSWCSEAVVSELEWVLKSGFVGLLYYRRYWNLGEVISKYNTIISSDFTFDRVTNDTHLHCRSLHL